MDCVRDDCPFYKAWYCTAYDRIMWPWIKDCPTPDEYEEEESGHD